MEIKVKLLKRRLRLLAFLAVQNSSIGDLVTHSLTDSLTNSTFTFDIQRTNSCDVYPILGLLVLAWLWLVLRL